MFLLDSSADEGRPSKPPKKQKLDAGSSEKLIKKSLKRKNESGLAAPAKKTKNMSGSATPASGGDGDGESPTRLLFVKNLAWSVDDDKLGDAFPDATDVHVLKERDTGRSRGIAFVEFDNEEAAQKARDLMNGKELDGRALNIVFNTPRENRDGKGSGGRGRGGGDRGRGGRGRGNDRGRGGSRGRGGDRGGRGGRGGGNRSFDNDTPTRLLMVKNLSYGVDNDSLSEAFPGASDARVVKDRESGKSRGFGFVEFDDIEAAKKAKTKMTGKEVDGRSVSIVFATPREDYGGGGSGDRGRGRGGKGDRGRGRGGRGGRGSGRGGFQSGGFKKGAQKAAGSDDGDSDSD